MNEAQERALRQSNEWSRFLTREALIGALNQLIDEKDFRDIRVTELCRRAGVSRQAFYRNFASLDDVLNESVAVVAREITEGLTTDIHQNWLHIFEVVEKERSVMQTLLKAELEHVILRFLNAHLPSDEKERKIQAVWNGVIYNLIVDWVVDPRPMGCQEMADLAYALTKDIPPVARLVRFPVRGR